MRLVETKTYQIEMTDGERKEIKNICNKIEEIERQFGDKDAFFIDWDGDRCLLEKGYIDHVTEFLQALAENEVEVY